ncbi:hypothetical protein MNQ95_10705 [Pseudoxanthomonas daejeonensis]|uniref:hypothetical protein n=1 Tax=Pseudoxanthomonas daejeonensis TaxID=266062 RepID=UPI001F53E80C|nr:hypothetical protein [Pseudoxanthomonas daejeonensis]UNK56624.1 hypothetical protein MNQ95_10705 [Pseudoxanthomonas daejeonensis]
MTRGGLCWRLAGMLAGAGLALGPVAAAAQSQDTQLTVVETPSQVEFLGGVLAESRVLYPLQVGSWVAESEHRYPEQRLGVSVRYIDNGKQRWIDLYFYPAGLQSVQSLALVAGSERDGIADAARQAGREVALGMLEPIELARGGVEGHGVDAAAPAAGMQQAWKLGLAYPDERVASAMLLFAHDLYLVKARASAPLSSPIEDELVRFMQVVAAQLRIVNTGRCWLAARTDIVDALPASGHDRVRASYRDPGRDVAAVVVDDRVLVARGEAARAQALAKELTGTLYPGCVAPEAIEPEVPPSMREMRIEYRAPNAVEGPSRGPRIGRPQPPQSGTG